MIRLPGDWIVTAMCAGPLTVPGAVSGVGVRRP